MKLLVSILFAIALTARATPIGGSLSAEASVKGSSGLLDSNSDSSSWINVVPSVPPLPLIINAPVFDTFYYNVSTTSTAIWYPNGNQGGFDLYSIWETAPGITVQTTMDWSYTFTADKNENFVMDYQLSGQVPINEPFGLQTFSLTGDFDDSSGSEWPVNPGPDIVEGTFVGRVTAGNTYTVSLYEAGSVDGSSLPPQDYLNGSVNGSFEWSLNDSTTVPDRTSTLLLLGVAFATLFCVRRGS